MLNKEEEISDAELASLSKAILTRYNIDFTHYEPRSLKRRVKSAIVSLGMENLFELWSKLLKDRNFVFDFIDQITVGMTSMFRDPQMWVKMKKDILPKMMTKNEIRIWHTGCSTGEEVYTMGIVMKELMMNQKAKAIATDLNRNSIETAKNGIFTKVNHRQNQKQYSEYNSLGSYKRYGKEQGDEIVMNPDLVKHVDFKVHNLVSEPMNEKFDIIFCRNILIYFDEELKKRILNEMYDRLNDDGYFIIGFFDALIPLVDPNLFEFYDLNAKIFKKKSK